MHNQRPRRHALASIGLTCIIALIPVVGIPAASALEAIETFRAPVSVPLALREGQEPEYMRSVSRGSRGGAVARGSRGTVARGPRGGVAARGYRGGTVARGPRGAVAARGAYGGAVARGARGNVAVRSGYYRAPVRAGGWYRPTSYWWRPGGAIAAGAAIGFVTAAAATAYAGQAPAQGYCWYYTNPQRTQGFWDNCPY